MRRASIAGGFDNGIAAANDAGKTGRLLHLSVGLLTLADDGHDQRTDGRLVTLQMAV